MARPVIGSLRPRGLVWEVSFDSARLRARETFPDRTTAQRWRDAAAAAVAAGRTPPAAEQYRRPLAGAAVQRELTDAQRDRTPLRVGFESFMRVRYDVRKAANPERAATVRSYWDNHIEPFLTAAIDVPGGACWQDVHAEVATALASHLAGVGTGAVAQAALLAAPDLWLEGGQEMTAAEAAVQAEVSVGTINRRRASGTLPATLAVDGSWRYTHQGLREAGLLGTGPLPTGLSKRYAREILTVPRMVMDHVRAHGATGVPGVNRFLQPIAPNPADRLNPDDGPTRCATWQETRHVAAHLHVIWQLALWMLRALGLRIGEIFGPCVGDVVDLGDCGFLAIERQGGRPFLTRDEHGNTVITATKDPKTPQSVRVLPLPVALLALIRVVIAAFHTDPDTGVVDLEARLLPPLQAAHGGQSGLRQALTTAANAIALTDVQFNPHSHRAALVTDLHELTDLDGPVIRRMFGHLPGRDVHAKHYQRDHPLRLKLKKVVAQIDEMIATELGGTLLVPTTAQPSFARGSEAASRWPAARAVLRTAGWMPDPLLADEDPLLDADQGADLLGVSPAVLRRAMAAGALVTERRRVRGKWVGLVRLSVLAAERDRRDALEQLPDLCADISLAYDVAKRLLRTRGEQLERDPITGWHVVPPRVAAELRAIAAEHAALQARSVRINEASMIIGCGLTHGRVLLGRGDLVADPETDYAGRTYVTRASVERAKQAWQSKHRSRRPRADWLDGSVAADALQMTLDQLELIIELRQLDVRQSHHRKQVRRSQLLAFAELHRPKAVPALRVAT